MSATAQGNGRRVDMVTALRLQFATSGADPALDFTPVGIAALEATLKPCAKCRKQPALRPGTRKEDFMVFCDCAGVVHGGTATMARDAWREGREEKEHPTSNVQQLSPSPLDLSKSRVTSNEETKTGDATL